MRFFIIIFLRKIQFFALSIGEHTLQKVREFPKKIQQSTLAYTRPFVFILHERNFYLISYKKRI